MILDKLLLQFYASSRTKKEDVYSAKSMHCIKLALQRHFLSIKSVDIKGNEFPLSNRVLKATIVKLKGSGKGCLKNIKQIYHALFQATSEIMDSQKIVLFLPPQSIISIIYIYLT